MLRNYKKAATLASPIELSALTSIQVEGLSGMKFRQKIKQVYQTKEGIKWMIDCGTPPVLNSYIAGGLYRLVLDEFAPNEQLFRDQDGNICLGSEFIEGFIGIGPYSKAMIGEVDYNYIQKTFLDSKNGQLVAAIMVLMGEYDANGFNLGVVSRGNGEVYLSKIDHDHSTGISSENFKTAAIGLNMASSRTVIDPLDNKDSFVQALKVIAEIPDELWREVIQERVAAYHNAMGTSYESSSELPGIAKKAAILHYVDGLMLENAIESGNVEEIEQLITSGYNFNQKYYYISSGSYGGRSPILPIEMAAAANKVNIIEFFYNMEIPNDQVQKQLLKISTSSNYSEVIKFIIQHESFQISDKEYLEIAISSPNIVMLQHLLDQNKAINFSGIDDVQSKIISSDNALAYQKWCEYNGRDSEFYILDLKEKLRSVDSGFNKDSVNIIKFLIVKLALEVNNYETAAELVSVITKTKGTRGFFEDIATKSSAKNLFYHFFRNDEEIVDYFVNKFEDYRFKITTEYQLSYIIDCAQDPTNVLKNIVKKISLNLKEMLDSGQTEVYEVFLKTGYINEQEFTKDSIESLFNKDCSDLFIKSNHYNKIEIDEGGCENIKGDILGKIHEIVRNSGVHFNVSTMYKADSLFFQSSPTIKYYNINKLIELFTSKEGDIDAQELCIESDRIILDTSININAKKNIEECHIMHHYEVPDDFDQLNFSIAEDRIIVSSEHVISTFVVDVVSGTLLHSECSII